MRTQKAVSIEPGPAGKDHEDGTNSLRGSIRRHPVTWFFLLSFLLSWAPGHRTCCPRTAWSSGTSPSPRPPAPPALRHPARRLPRPHRISPPGDRNHRGTRRTADLASPDDQVPRQLALVRRGSRLGARCADHLLGRAVRPRPSDREDTTRRGGTAGIRADGPGRCPTPPDDRAGGRLPHRQRPGRRRHGALRAQVPGLAVARPGQRTRLLGSASALRLALEVRGLGPAHRESVGPPRHPGGHPPGERSGRGAAACRVLVVGLWLAGMLGLLFADDTDQVIAHAYTGRGAAGSRRGRDRRSSSAPSRRCRRTAWPGPHSARPPRHTGPAASA